MRNMFINELVSLARVHPNIMLVVGDLGYSVVEPFAEEFPERFINAGVAEQNMMGLAGGLASEGFHVFTYSIANFPTFRCAEQIRNDIAYHNLAVTNVVVGGGLSYGALGYSHHAVQDYSLMRSMPNMLIAAPGDPIEVKAALDYLVCNPGPSYLRLGKAGEPTYHRKKPSLEVCSPLLVEEGGVKRRAFLTTGAAALSAAYDWKLRPEYADYSIYSLPLWSMNEKKWLVNFLEGFDKVITVEDHLYDGGFGSWVSEIKTRTRMDGLSLECIALDSVVCGAVASQSELHRLGGLSPPL